MSLIIRTAEVEDIPSIVGVRLAALTEDEIRGFSAPEFATFSSIEKLQKAWGRENRLKDGFEVFVAEDEGKIVGFIVFRIRGDYGYIDNLVVAKEEQRKGIGKALVAYAENMAESNGCCVVKTDTTENADGIPWKAYGFWTRIGYQDTGERLPTKYHFKEIPLIKRIGST
jgi:ribosomal protein S18 acetylase RimI-like enzyme